MNTEKRRHAIAAYCCAVLLVCAGCASPAGGRSGESPQAFTSLPSIGNDASTINVAGRYRGKFLLKSKPIGDASFDLTQSGTAVGGTLTLLISKHTTNEPVAITLDTSSGSFSGNATDPTGKQPCTYALSGSYNPKTFVLRGTSSPLTCTGKVANFRTTESCYYVTTPSANARRPDARGITEC